MGENSGVGAVSGVGVLWKAQCGSACEQTASVSLTKSLWFMLTALNTTKLLAVSMPRAFQYPYRKCN